MRSKDLFNVVRYLCIAGILIFGLVAITGTSDDDVEDATCVSGEVTGTYVFTEPNSITITVDDITTDPLDVDLSDIGFDDFIEDATYTYTYDETELDTAMDWIQVGGEEDEWNWQRVGESTGDYTGDWKIEDPDGITYELHISADPLEFAITAEKCLLD